MIAGATFTDDGSGRLTLWRVWDIALPTLVLGMLNPSKADAQKNDPTVRKGIGFAQRNGFGGLMVCNLSEHRATKPADLFAHLVGRDTITPENRAAILSLIKGRVVALAWGAHGRRLPSSACEFEFLAGQYAARVCVLDRLADGTPAHPLILPYDAARRPGGTL